jgi:hypothetical protein
MDGLHGLGVIQPLQHLHLPAEGFQLGPSSGGNPPMTCAESRSLRMASCNPATASQE